MAEWSSGIDMAGKSSISLPRSPVDDLRTITPAKSVSFADDDTEAIVSNDMNMLASLRPSLADQIRVGYFSMDRSCQTEKSDIINLKETTALLISLVQDINALKKNLYYAKLALQADYDAKIENRSLELHKHAVKRIQEIEKLHEERVKVVRRSFKTQLADAIKKISTDYRKYYSKKEEQQDSKHLEEIEKLAKIQEEKEQLAQQEMMEMMQLQISDGDEEEDAEEISNTPSVSSEVERHAEEIRNLTDVISNLEDKVEELQDLLDLGIEEREKLSSKVESIELQLDEEKNYSSQLKRDLMEEKLAAEIEKKNFKLQLEKQKEELQQHLQEKVEQAKNEASEAATKRISDLEDAAKMKEHKIKEEMKMKEMMMNAKHEQLQQNVNESDYNQLKEIEKQQRIELVRLQKEMEKSNKTWELKVAILHQTIHALKDEMFLRNTLQRQSAKLQHAAITYANNGPVSKSAEVAPAKPPTSCRKYQMPSLVQGPVNTSDITGAGTGDFNNGTSRNVESRNRTGVSSRLSQTNKSTQLLT